MIVVSSFSVFDGSRSSAPKIHLHDFSEHPGAFPARCSSPKTETLDVLPCGCLLVETYHHICGPASTYEQFFCRCGECEDGWIVVPDPLTTDLYVVCSEHLAEMWACALDQQWTSKHVWRYGGNFHLPTTVSAARHHPPPNKHFCYGDHGHIVNPLSCGCVCVDLYAHLDQSEVGDLDVLGEGCSSCRDGVLFGEGPAGEEPLASHFYADCSEHLDEMRAAPVGPPRTHRVRF